MNEKSLYNELIARNRHYVNEEVQNKIKNTKLLIAGCGIGSSFAILAARMGFMHFILADGDVVNRTNLNRQFYTENDINFSKAKSLANHIKEINPEASIEVVDEYLTANNTAHIIQSADFIFDTIDFLDLMAIVELHDQCEIYKKPRITAMSIGYDAGLIYFPGDSTVTFRELFGLPRIGSVSDIPYAVAFEKVLKKLYEKLRPEVIFAVSQALTVMEDGRPCPASQVAPGSFALASLAGTLMYRVISGEKVSTAPSFIMTSMHENIINGSINLESI